jgi:hypothetical protein
MNERLFKTAESEDSVGTHSDAGQAKATLRTLKIEEDGDYWKRKIKPKIRLKGQWLERAGFKPGEHVIVDCVTAGVIQLRSIDSGLNKVDQRTSPTGTSPQTVEKPPF